jgi:hypothetical protein
VRRILRHDAIIVDDIGYMQQSRQQMQVLFTLVADRYERGSLPFSKWEQFFKDLMVTAAAIDRRVHHRVILALNIERYRMKVANKNKSKKLMARKKSLYEWILGNANLWAEHRSLNVGHLAKPFFRQIKKGSRNMEQTAFNPQNGRPETINIESTDESTIWFDESEDSHGIFSITDFQGGILNQRS